MTERIVTIRRRDGTPLVNTGRVSRHYGLLPNEDLNDAVARIAEDAHEQGMTRCEFQNIENPCPNTPTWAILLSSLDEDIDGFSSVVCNRCFGYMSIYAPVIGVQLRASKYVP
jgi:hypothetical protein